MLLPLRLGRDLETNDAVHLPHTALSRHFHCVGATGSGKTVALHALLKPILKQPHVRTRTGACVFVIDPLGGLSHDLLMWIASPRCPSHVRERLLYIEPANNEVVLPFNPLQYAVGDDLYYHTARTVDLIMRAWQATDMSQQPRLMQWSYQAMTAIAQMKLPIALSEYLLHPGSDEHKAILRQMPDHLRCRWMEILNARGSESTRILESTRNRFDPIYSAPQVRRMLGVTNGRLDVERLICERRIVIINVAKLGKMPQLLGSTIGALILNEIFETAFRMTSVHGRSAVDPTLVVLDEFQRFVSADIEDALPTVRQVGLQLCLAHQSFSQLEQGEIDLRNMIWQAQNRLMFANNAEDADIIANELAVLDYDALLVKKAIYNRKQLVRDHRRVWLETEGFADTTTRSEVSNRSVGYNRSSGTSHPLLSDQYTSSRGHGHSSGTTTGLTKGHGHSASRGRHEVHLPVYEELNELASIQYYSFDEQRLEWMKRVRQLKTGHCFGKFVDDDRLRRILIDYQPVRETAAAEQRLQELKQRNYEQDFFISKNEADRFTEEARQQLLQPSRIVLTTPEPVIDGTQKTDQIAKPEPPAVHDPFQWTEPSD